LNRHGFAIRKSPACPPWAVRSLDNSNGTEQGAASDRLDRIGVVDCSTFAVPHGRLARDPKRVWEYLTTPTGVYPGREFVRANVSCVLYLDKTTRADAESQLRAVFEHL
jgi:hypothetical protein